MMSEEIKYELFAKKLSDSLLEGEEKILRDWINESVENATEYAVAKQAWSAVENFEIETNTQDAWQKLQNSISVEENKNNKNWKTRYFTIAASLLLLIGLGGGIWRMQSSTPTLYTADETTKKVILSDGSIVWLNAHSSLSVPTNFAKAKKREVSLTGEAFF
jgi:transmembrane sensor